MPRTNRLFEPDAIYHIMGRGVERRLVFLTSQDRQYFMSRLLEVLREGACSLFAYCLMGNHFHLLIGVARKPLGVPMHDLLTSYSMRFNIFNERVGHLFQSRFTSRLIHDERYLHNAIAYIHENPVRAKLVSSLAGWGWSSHRDWVAFDGVTIDFARLEELVGIPAATIREEYLRRTASMSSPAPKGMSLEELIFDTATMLGIDPAAIKAGQRGALFTKAKLILAERAAIEGFSAIKLAAALNCDPAAIAMAKKRR